MASQNWTLTPSGYCYPDDAPAEGFQLPLKSTPPSPVPVRVVSFLSTLTQQEVSVWDSQTPDTAQLVSKLDETRISQAFLTAVTSTGQDSGGGCTSPSITSQGGLASTRSGFFPWAGLLTVSNTISYH